MLLVICGDHGEAFGQHPGNFGHVLFLHEENVRVPLLFAAPGLTDEPVRVGRVASLADLAPTVLDLLGLPLPSECQGRSLLGGRSRVALFCTDYSLALVGLRDGRWKCIHEVESGRTWLFDLAADPAEMSDVAGEYPERAGAYREHLLRWARGQKYRILVNTMDPPHAAAEHPARRIALVGPPPALQNGLRGKLASIPAEVLSHACRLDRPGRAVVRRGRGRGPPAHLGIEGRPATPRHPPSPGRCPPCTQRRPPHPGRRR